MIYHKFWRSRQWKYNKNLPLAGGAGGQGGAFGKSTLDIWDL